MIGFKAKNTAIPVLRALVSSIRAEFTTAIYEAVKTTFDFVKDDYFKSQSYEGEPWKPLAKATVLYKQQIGLTPPYKILNVSGNLMGNWQALPLRFGCVLWGTNVPYAALHQYGGTVTIGPHTVKAHSVKSHMVRAHTVREHTRRQNGKTVTVRQHEVKEHRVSGRTGPGSPIKVRQHEVKGGGKRTIPARPFLPANRTAYEMLCEEIPDAMASHGIHCDCRLVGGA